MSSLLLVAKVVAHVLCFWERVLSCGGSIFISLYVVVGAHGTPIFQFVVLFALYVVLCIMLLPSRTTTHCLLCSYSE
jgi:hypothetical protein